MGQGHAADARGGDRRLELGVVRRLQHLHRRDRPGQGGKRDARSGERGRKSTGATAGG